MRVDTRARKNATKPIRHVAGERWLADLMLRIIKDDKQAFEPIQLEIGRCVAEAIILMEREERSGPNSHPTDPTIRK